MRFCDECFKLNINPAKFLPPADLEEPPWSHKCNVYIRPSECDLCQLIAELIEATVAYKIPSVVDDRGARTCLVNSRTPIAGNTKSKFQPCIALEIHGLDRIYEWGAGIRPATKDPLRYPYFSRILPQGPSFLDFEHIQYWITRCESEHSHCRERSKLESEISVENVLVIDVVGQRIVPAPENCRYIALSYVWGNATQVQLKKDNLLDLSRESSLSSPTIPKTIRDAMILVEKIGERYLWVDALCIVSDDAAARQAAISNMDNIYAGSLLTIVAGNCSSADDPLRGVSTERYCKQITRAISSEVTLLAHFDIEHLFRETKYCERAWTFQEFQLASRLLVFAPNDQVYFLCDEASYTEDGPDDCVRSSSDRLAVSNNKSEFTFSLKRRLHGHLPHTNYRWALARYSKLKITKEEDILNAFAGVVKRIGVGSCYEGLPLAYFNHALFWKGGTLERRKCFPSWTWAGWSGLQLYCSEEIDYLHMYGDAKRYPNDGHREWVHKASEMELIQLCLKHATWIVYYVCDNASADAQPRWLHGGDEYGKDVDLAREAHEARFPGLPRNSLPTKLCYERSDGTAGFPSVLHFWTVSVYYEVRDHPPREQPVMGGGDDNMIDSEGNSVGKCEYDAGVNSEEVEAALSCREFIIISEEGDLSYERRESASYVPSQRYRVLMIEWNGDVAERIGSGYLQREGVFKSCRRPMKWKEIVLA